MRIATRCGCASRSNGSSSGERDLSRLALDLGYSSHSHFTAAFRRSFDVPPSAARKLLIVRA